MFVLKMFTYTYGKTSIAEVSRMVNLSICFVSMTTSEDCDCNLKRKYQIWPYITCHFSPSDLVGGCLITLLAKTVRPKKLLILLKIQKWSFCYHLLIYEVVPNLYEQWKYLEELQGVFV